MSRVFAAAVVLALAIVTIGSAVHAAEEERAAAAVAAAADTPQQAAPPVESVPAPVPFADPRTLTRIDPRDTTCATPEQRVSFAFELETEVLDEAVANATGHAIALKLVTTNVTLNGCRYTAQDPHKPKAEPWELITAADLFTADECAKLIAFAESKQLFAGRRVPLPATATDAEKAAYAAAASTTPVPDAAAGYINESLAHAFGLELEPLEDRLAAWLNVTVEELEYFQIVKLVDGSSFSRAPFQYSPSRDIDYTNSRVPLSADDMLIADAIQHHRIASVFVFLSAPAEDGDATNSGGWSQFPGTLNVRVQPRVGSALYWPTPQPPAVEYNGSDPNEAEAAVAAVTAGPIVHVAEPSTSGGVRYGLNVWVYPNVWRGDVDDDITEDDAAARGTIDDDGDDDDDAAAAVFDDEEELVDDEDDADVAELREFDAEDDEDLDRSSSSPEVDVVGGGGVKEDGADDDDDDALPPGGEDGDADDEADGGAMDDGDDDGGDNPFLQYMSDAELETMARKQDADAKAKDDKVAAAAAAAAGAGGGDATTTAAHVHTEL